MHYRHSLFYLTQPTLRKNDPVLPIAQNRQLELALWDLEGLEGYLYQVTDS